MKSVTGKIKYWVAANYDLAVTVMLAVVYYLLVFGPASLNPANYQFLMAGGDLSQNYLGGVLYRAEPWSWNVFKIYSLGYPFGTSLLAPDSNPLMSVIFKTFTTWFGMPPHYQFFGIWTLLCFILSAIASVYIFRHIFKDAKQKWLVIIAGTFFVASPIMLVRVFIQVNLLPHWLILFAVLMYLNNRLGLKEWLLCGLLVFLSFVIHPYFLPMVIAVLAALILKKLFKKEINVKTFITGVTSLAVFSFIMIFVTNLHLCIGDRTSSGAGTSMNLTSLFNPVWAKSFFIKTHPVAQWQYEGDNYLGAGLIILFFFLLLSGDLLRPVKKRSLWNNKEIIAAFLFLTAFVFSNNIYFGDILVLRVKLVGILNEISVLFRSKGRLFWPCWYLIVFYFIYLLNKYHKIKIKYILPFLLIIQFVDFIPLYAEKRNFIKQNSTTDIGLMFKSEKWDKIFADTKHIIIFSEDNFKDIWFKAYQTNNTVNDGYFALKGRNIINYTGDILTYLVSGNMPELPNAVFILHPELYSQLSEIKTPQMQKLLSKVRELDGIRFVFYDPELMSVTPSSVVGTKVYFNVFYVKSSGLSVQESWGRWSNGKESVMQFYVGNADRDLRVAFSITPFLHRKHRKMETDVFAGNTKVANWKFVKDEELPSTEFIVPRSAVDENGILKLTFKINKPRSPSSLGMSTDNRLLALGFESMKIEHAD